ncbi:MAG: ABC transporter substrate-binding protein [Fibrobacter sp.]|nr:ABC transporter substrate-binding protein [Fibrobacter sp.]
MKLKVIWFFLLCVATIWANPGDPTVLVKAKDKELQVLLRKSTRSEKDVQKMKVLINNMFDFSLLAAKSVPTATWKDLSSTQQNEFVSAFKQMVENSSVKQLEVYRSDSTIYEKPKIRKNSAQVAAQVWYKGKASHLVYKFDLVDDQWRAWDLIIDDLSTARNYREQFNSILRTKSFDELLEIVQKKAAEIK